LIYIVTALKPEAQAFVDKFKLKKSKLSNFTIFSNDTLKVIISGLGVYNSMIATQTFINYFDITDDDIYINIGICGANKDYNISELIEISEVKYKKQIYTLNSRQTKTIICLDEEVNDDKYEIVDMESFGFLDAVLHSTAIKNRYIFKIVSDHFEPETVTKDKTKKLVFDKIEKIFKRIDL